MPNNDYIEQVPIQRESTTVKKPLLDTGQRKIKVKEDKLAMEIAQQILSDAKTQSNGIANGRFNTDYPLQTEHPELWIIPAAAEIKAAGLVPGMFRFAVGTVTGNEIGKQSTNIGQKIDSKLGTRIFAPTLGFIGGLGGYAFGSGFTGNMLSRIPRKYSYGPTNERTYWAEDQTPKYNSSQITGHFGKVKYYGPTMGKTTAVASNPKLVDFDDIIRQPSRTILDRYGFRNKSEMYNSGNREAIKAYEDMLVKTLQDWRANPENSNLTLVASPTAIANPSNTGFYFDNVPSIPSRDVFIARNIGRGGTPEASALWYDSLIKQNPNLKTDDRFVSQIESKSYQSPSTSQLEIVPQAAYASEVPVITKQNATSIADAQWDAAYNEAVKSGNIAEAQRLRDLHFITKAPDTKIVDKDGNLIHMVHGSQAKFTEFRPGGPHGSSGRGMYFGKAPENMDKWSYGGKNGYKYPVYLNAKNLYDYAWLRERDSSGKIIYGPVVNSIIGANSYKQFLDDMNVLDKTFPDWLKNDVKRIDESTYNRIHDKYDAKGIFRSDKHVVKHLFRKNDEYVTLDPESIGEIVVRDPRQIKLSDAITYDDSGQIIPLSKRDDFNDPDIRYAMSENGLEGVRQRWFHTIIHPNHFYGKPDLEYAGIPKGDRNFKFKTMRFRMTPGESEAAQLWSKKRNIWDRYKAVTKKRGLEFNEYDEPLVPIISSVADTKSFDDPIFAQSNLVKVFQQYGGKNMLNESELKFKPEELQQGWIDYFNSPQYRERVRQNSGLSEPEIDRFINEMIANMKSAHHTYMTLPQIVEKKIPSYNPKTGDFDIKTVLAQGSEGGHYEPNRHLVVINNSRGKNTPVNFEHEDLHATLRPGTYPREVLDKSGLINGIVLNQINGIRGMVFPGEPLTFSNGLVEKPSFAQKPFNRYLAGRDEARVRGLKILRYLDEHNLPITEENVGKILDEMNAYDANQLSSFTRQSVIDYLKKLYILPLTVGLGATAINKNQNK